MNVIQMSQKYYDLQKEHRKLKKQLKALKAVAEAAEEFVARGGNYEELDKTLKNWQKVKGGEG